MGEVELSFVKYSASKKVHLRPDIVEYPRGGLQPLYLIIGKKTLHDIGAVLDFKEKTLAGNVGICVVGFITQTTDIFVYCRHVANVSPTQWQYSVMSANILAVSVMSGNFVADTISYM